MKFNVDAKLFSAMLATAAAHSTRNAASIGGFFRIKAEGDSITIGASCQISDFEGKILADIVEPGDVAVVADKLQAIASLISTSTVETLEVGTTNTGKLSLKDADNKMKGFKAILRTLSAEKFPKFPECPENKWGKIDAELLANAISHISPIADKGNEQLEIRKAFHIEQNVRTNDETGEEETVLTFVATNGRSLGTESYVIDSEDAIPEFVSANLPAAFMNRILSVIGREAKDAIKVGFAFHEGRVFVRTETSIMAMSLFNDKYCAWNRVIPQDTPETPLKWAEVNEKELYQALSIIAVATDEKTRKITFEFSDNKIDMYGANTDGDEVEQSVEAQVSDINIKMGINKDLIIPCLKGLEAAKASAVNPIKIGLRNDKSAIVIRRMDNVGPLYVVMPMEG